MEFAVSNFPVKNFKSLEDKVFYQGVPIQSTGLLIFKDGFLLDPIPEETVYETLRSDNSIKGIYSFVFVDTKRGIVSIKNDPMGKVPLYYWSEGEKFIVSNNVWVIVQALDYPPQDLINLEVLKSLVYFVTIPHEEETFFKNVKRFPNGSIGQYFLQSFHFRIDRYFKFQHSPNSKLKITDEAIVVDEMFTDYFRRIKELEPGRIMGFGNSGGFDSRLIAHYASKLQIPSVAYVIGERKPHYFFDSTTKYLSDKIATKFNIDKKWLNYNCSDIEDSMLVDVRNNPFHSTQVFKNDFRALSLFDFEITGQPGSMPKGLPEKIMMGSRDDLIEYTIETYSYILDSLRGGVRLQKLSLKHLGLPYSANYGDSYFADLFPEEEYLSYAQKFRDAYSVYSSDDQFTAWENYNERIIVKNDYLGGYESFSRMKKSYFLYYPGFFDRISLWPKDFFYGRRILKVLFETISPFLSNLPGQDFQSSKDRRKQSLARKIEMAIRGRGLNYNHFLQSAEYVSFAKAILGRYNPAFDKLVNVSLLMNSSFINTLAGANLVKLKLILDIVYYKEFDRIQDERFRIV